MLSIKKLSVCTKVILVMVLALVLLELVFDPVEIVLGKLLLCTNRIRPKVGRLWAEEEKDQAGLIEVTAISKTAGNSMVIESVQDLDELIALIDLRGKVVISRQNFLSLYKQIPPEKAAAIVAPLDLIEIDHSNEWQYARFVAGDFYLQIYLLDNSGQVLLDSYPKRDILKSETVSDTQETALHQDPAFRGRILSAETFHSAYNRLPRTLRMQIINNPYKLIQWGDDLKYVAISRYVENSTVEIAFEVQTRVRSSVHRFQARELAIEHLIAIINERPDSISIDLPVQRDSNK